MELNHVGEFRRTPKVEEKPQMYIRSRLNPREAPESLEKLDAFQKKHQREFLCKLFHYATSREEKVAQLIFICALVAVRT